MKFRHKTANSCKKDCTYIKEAPQVLRGFMLYIIMELLPECEPRRKSNCAGFKIDVLYQVQFRFPIQRKIERDVAKFIINTHYSLCTKICFGDVSCFFNTVFFTGSNIATCSIQPLKTWRAERAMKFQQ